MLFLMGILIYGRDYGKETEIGPLGGSIKQNSEHDYWYHKKTCRTFHRLDLISLGVCTFSDPPEHLLCLGYIRLFKVNLVNLEKEFVQSYGDKQLRKHMKDVPEIRYDYDFRVYLERDMSLTPLWVKHERNALLKAAISWCQDNEILYTIEAGQNT